MVVVKLVKCVGLDAIVRFDYLYNREVVDIAVVFVPLVGFTIGIKWSVYFNPTTSFN
jgi:hypothetical protein